ncbi:hypothetical protein QBC45DRAFT_113254 [Copromyces sp. CBS 386.78]|nr:hypothetical protein QBC45DRAFT_113254 [Copromyces sp. CBS 386.78]
MPRVGEVACYTALFSFLAPHQHTWAHVFFHILEPVYSPSHPLIAFSTLVILTLVQRASLPFSILAVPLPKKNMMLLRLSFL